jgi:hypothetical protein
MARMRDMGVIGECVSDDRPSDVLCGQFLASRPCSITELAVLVHDELVGDEGDHRVRREMS